MRYPSSPMVAMLLVGALLAGRVVFLRGCVVPIRTSSGSMAYALLGPHFSLVCRDCGFPFQCGAEYPPEQHLAICPNCGYRQRVPVATALSPGHRVLIDPPALWWHRPRPWRIVAFQEDRGGKRWSVKRVIAGAGQHVSLSDGDVYLNGRLLRKTMAQFRSIAIPVHDDAFRPTIDPTLPNRWHSERSETGWAKNDQGYEYSDRRIRQSGQAIPVDWLEYHPWTCRANPVPPVARTHPSPILDDYGYNQSCSRGSLHVVHDVLLTVRVQLDGNGCVVVRVADRGHLFQVVLSPESGRYQLLDNDDSVLTGRRRFRNSPFILELALCDGRVIVAINRLVLFEYAFEATTFQADGTVPSKQLAIGAADASVQLGWPRIERDVFYLGPHNEVRWSASGSVPQGHFFVLGDNVPVSLDSRHGMLIPEQDLLGTIIRCP